MLSRWILLRIWEFRETSSWLDPCVRAGALMLKPARALPFVCVTTLTAALVAAAAGRVSTVGVDVVTYHNDVARTGQNLNETIADAGDRRQSPRSASWVSTRPTARSTRSRCSCPPFRFPGTACADVLYVATEHDSVYALRRRHRRDALARLAARRRRDAERPTQLRAGHAGDRHHLDAGHRSIARAERRRSTSSPCRRTARALLPAAARARRRDRQRAVRRAARRFRRRSREPAPAVPAASSRSIRSSTKSALGAARWSTDADHHGVDVSLRHRSVHRLDHGLRRRQRWRRRACSTSRPTARVAASGWRAPGPRRIRQAISICSTATARSTRRSTATGFPNQRNFGNAFLKIVDRRRPGGGRLLRDVRHRVAVQRRHGSRLGRRAGLPGFRRRGGRDAAPGRRRRQGRPHLRRRSRRDGQVERVVEPELPGHQRRAGRQRCSRCRRTSTARCTTARPATRSRRSRSRAPGWRPTPSSKRRVVSVSGHDAGHFRVRHVERHRVGGRELESRGAARLRRHQPGASSCTTRRRRPAAATASAPATSSSRRPSSTAASMSARRPASRCSVRSAPAPPTNLRIIQ